MQLSQLGQANRQEGDDKVDRYSVFLPLVTRCSVSPIWVLVILATLSGGCADITPRPGELVALRVSGQVTNELFRYGRKIDIANAIAHGVGESEIESGRLAVVICALPMNEANPEAKWIVRIPANVTLRRDDLVMFKPGVRYGSAGPLGTFAKVLPTPAPAALYAWKYGKTVLCAINNETEMLQARFAFAFGSDDVREHRLHQERMRRVDESEVRTGQIFIATCSRMTDGWTEWTVRVPPSLRVKVGDYIVARAGTPDDEPGSDISEAVRKIDSPTADQTYVVQGSRIIRCNAVVVSR